MKFPVIVLVGLIVILGILLALILLGVFKPAIPPQTEFEARLAQNISLQQGFCLGAGGCNGEPVTCTSDSNDTNLCRGNCLLYETLSTETDIVDNLQPIGNLTDPNIPDEIKCLDGFIQALQKRTATCQANECVGRDGNRYTSGQSEEFYIKCGDLEPCTQTFRSAIIFNYHPDQGRINSRARCLSSRTQNGTTTFSIGNCSNQVTLNDDTFLNVITQKSNGEELVQIRAPLTGDCLSNVNGKVGAVSCSSLGGDGFNWVYTQPIEIKNFSDQTARIYPAQLVEITSESTKALTDLESLFKELETKVQDLSKFVNGLSRSQQRIFLQVLTTQDVNNIIELSIKTELEKLIADLNTLIPFLAIAGIRDAKRGIDLAVDIINLYIKIFEILGVTDILIIPSGFSGGKVNSLQFKRNEIGEYSDRELTVAPIGSCPSSTVNSQVACPFNTVIVPAESWNCVNS